MSGPPILGPIATASVHGDGHALCLRVQPPLLQLVLASDGGKLLALLVLIVKDKAIGRAPVLEEGSDFGEVLWKLLVLFHEDPLLPLGPDVSDLLLQKNFLFETVRKLKTELVTNGFFELILLHTIKNFFAK